MSANTTLHRLPSNIALRGFDALFISSIAIILALGFARPAYGYVDPSIMTYTIQALAGVAVALSAVLGVVWRRLRRHLLRALQIDENANREIDPPVHRIKTDDPERSALQEEARNRARAMRTALNTTKPEKLNWRARFAFALIAAVLVFFTVMVIAPLEIVAGSYDSLLFGVKDIVAPIVTFSCLGALTFAALISLLRGKAFNVAFALVIAFGVAAYLQASLMNAGLPAADGTQVAWENYTKITLVSALAWLAVLVGCVTFSLKKPLAFKGVATLASIALIAAQSIGLGLLLTTPNANGTTPLTEKLTVTRDGLMDVSSDKNIVVFVLDTFDTRYLNGILETHPEALDEFTGFTYFDNSTGSMIPTRYALSSMATGKYLTPEGNDSYSTTLIKQWFAEHNLLDSLNEQGYSVNLYSGDVNDALDTLSTKTENVHSVDFTANWMGTIRMLGTCALYRDLPWFAKAPFWFYTDQVNNAVMPSDNPNAIPWTMDDALYYSQLQENKLRVVDEGQSDSFRMIHLAGTHAPYTIDENAETVEGGTSLEQQGLGSLHIVGEYIKQMKQLGVYDNATIIVTADHGEWYLADHISGPTSPILLVKPAAGDSTAPVERSSVPTGHVDLAHTILDAAGGDGNEYGGMNMFEVPDAPRTRYYNSTSVVGEDYEYTSIRQWEITGNALDWSTWRETGVKWPITD